MISPSTSFLPKDIQGPYLAHDLLGSMHTDMLAEVQGWSGSSVGCQCGSLFLTTGPCGDGPNRILSSDILALKSYKAMLS